MKKFESPDYYQLDGLLSEDEKMIRSAVREWVDEQVLPIIEDHYQEAKFPKNLIPQMAELGLFGANKANVTYLNRKEKYQKHYCVNKM